VPPPLALVVVLAAVVDSSLWWGCVEESRELAGSEGPVPWGSSRREAPPRTQGIDDADKHDPGRRAAQRKTRGQTPEPHALDRREWCEA